MRYQATINIWTLTERQRARLQAGQWVSAGSGPAAPKGRYMGQKRSGTDVVLWTRNRGRYQSDLAAYRDYAKGCANG